MAKRLVIISHTAHFFENNKYYGWGPTIREIEELASKFDFIIHFAPLHKNPMPGGNLPYTKINIKYIRLLEAGGEDLFEKVKLLAFSPINIYIILSKIKRKDWIQVRAPSNIALVMLPVFSVLRWFNIWVKYAGNWNEPKPALTYRIQRWWLRNNLQHSYVTVNGKWKHQGDHLLAFENPCMNEIELLKAKTIAENKQYNIPLNICFVGQLDDNKGIINLIEALTFLNTEGYGRINKLSIVGDGYLMNKIREMVNTINIKVELLGYMSHNEIHKVYTESHINILPSKSEGFPKVIAEGAAYGCIPVVTDMSSLNQYINNFNGFLLPNNKPENIYAAVKKLIDLSSDDRKQMAMNAVKMAEKFTYEHYINRIFTDIIEANNKEH